MRRFGAVVALTLALASCEARAEITMRNDGSGTLGFSFLVSRDELRALQGFGGQDPFAEMKGQFREGPVPFTVQEFEENGGKGLRGSVPFKSVEEMKRLSSRLENDPGSGPLGNGLRDLTIERRGDGWHFEATTDTPDAGDFGGSAPAGTSPSIDPEQLAQLLKFSFRVTLPGERASTNATRSQPAAGGATTFIWQADITKAGPIRMVADTTAASGGGSSAAIPIAIVVGALLVIGGLLWSRTRRSARRADASGVAAVPPTPPPGASAPQAPWPAAQSPQHPEAPARPPWPPPGSSTGAPPPTPPGGPEPPRE